MPAAPAVFHRLLATGGHELSGLEPRGFRQIAFPRLLRRILFAAA
jgi:hypothetical protein